MGGSLSFGCSVATPFVLAAFGPLPTGVRSSSDERADLPSSRLSDVLLGRFCDGVSDTAISPTWGSLDNGEALSGLRSRDQNTQPDLEPSPGNFGGADGSAGSDGAAAKASPAC